MLGIVQGPDTITQALRGSPVQAMGVQAAVLTLRHGHLVELDVVHHGPNLPVLHNGVPRYLAEVYHPWAQRGGIKLPSQALPRTDVAQEFPARS